MKKKAAHPFAQGNQLFNLGFWVAIGLILGTVVGAQTGNVGVGLAIGLVVGAAIGVALRGRSLWPAAASEDDETSP